MADRACRNFQANVFNKNKCQNCYKLQEAHRISQSGLDLKTTQSFAAPVTVPSATFKASKAKTVVKSGVLSVLIHEATERAKTHQSIWNRRWVVLNSTGIVDYCVFDEVQSCSTDILVGKLNLDECTNMFVGEVDTGEPFSLGINTPTSTHYFQAGNRLDMDNWSRVFKPFLQVANAYPFRRGSRNSVGCIEAVSPPKSAAGLSRVASFGRSSDMQRPIFPPAPPRTSSTHPKTKFGPCDGDLHPSVESLKLELEKLREESKLYKEQQTTSTKQREAVHILEQELRTKSNRVKELERDHAKCKDYQKAVIFQEQELQDLRFTMKDLRQQLEEADKKSKQLRGKLSIHGRELAEAKADIDEANSIISIHKANIESLKSELSNVKQVAVERRGRVILTDEDPESDRTFQFEANEEGGQKQDIESRLSFLVQKLKQNERELMIRTKELEKANESRSKVAKYTRSLLQELETKLSNNERRLAETEYQLKNSNIELEYEEEQRVKIQEESGRLKGELEGIIDANKKAGLPVDAVAIMAEARRETSAEQTKARLEDESASREKELMDKIRCLESRLESMERVSTESKEKFRESEVELQATRIELERTRERLDLNELEESSGGKLKHNLLAKENELLNAQTTVSNLKDELTSLNRKNQELENKLDSIDEKLCHSLEKQFSLTEENEKHSKDKKVLVEQVAGLEGKVSDSKDEISSLKMALSESICTHDSNVEAERKTAQELQTSLSELEEVKSSLSEKLTEKDKELQALQVDTDKLKNELELVEASREDSNRIKELEQQIDNYETNLNTAKETILGYENQINDLRSQENEKRQLDDKNKDFENNIISLERELKANHERLSAAEERLLEYDVEEKLLNAELQKYKKYEVTQEQHISISNVDKLENDPSCQSDTKYEDLLAEKTSELIGSEKKVVELAEELEKRLSLEEETMVWIEGVETNLSKTENQLMDTRNVLLAKSQELEREKCNILDLVELSRKYIKELEGSLAEEKARTKELEKTLECIDSTDGVRNGVRRSLDTPDIAKSLGDKLAICERERDVFKARATELVGELEETKNQLNERFDSAEKAHQKDMENLSEDTLKVSGAAKTEGDELRLRLTARVITLQSDISELKAAHHEVVGKLKARHKKELENARREAILEFSVKQPIMETSEDMNTSLTEMEFEMKDMEARYETQMEFLNQSHQREMERLKRSSDHGEGIQTEVAQLQAEMEQMNKKYMQEIEMLKDKHSEELDQLKKDMAVVIQASMAGSYSPTKDASADGNTSQLKTRIKELEGEIDELGQKYNEELRIERESQQKELDQIRDDMMTVIQAVKSQQYDLEPDTEQLQRTIQEREAEIRRLKETQTDSEGSSSNVTALKLEKLEKANQLLTEEKEEIEKSLKRQEAATMFGLRRTEEMSNKIYQMQKEMEDIDRKYMKEINVYKDAYEREKDMKTGDGQSDDLSAEHEELLLEMEEMKLQVEENDALHENELRIYREKLGQEKLLDVEKLRLQIKGLEDSVEEIKLEHKREVEEIQEGHCKNVKNLTLDHKKELRNIKKETMTSTTKKPSQLDEELKDKISTLEFKIEELESLLEVKKRRHKEEVRSLKERLDEEMQRHAMAVRNYEGKLKEYDGGRRGSFSSTGPGASEYFRKQLAELRSENRSLKEELESARDKPVGQPMEKDVKQVSTQTSPKEPREPLKKTVSDSKIETSKRGIREPTTFTLSEMSEKPRKQSKTEVKSVAARVAMFQTTSKIDKPTRIK